MREGEIMYDEIVRLRAEVEQLRAVRGLTRREFRFCWGCGKKKWCRELKGAPVPLYSWRWRCGRCASVNPRTFSVNPEAELGGDGTASRPFRTLAEALNACTQGDIISLAPALYSGTNGLDQEIPGLPVDTLTELIALAKADKHQDFLWLAGAAGVPRERREAMWQGTRARLNKPAEAP